jgi:hypothetical protein
MRRIIQSATLVLLALCLAACAAPRPDAASAATPGAGQQPDPAAKAPAASEPSTSARRTNVAGVPDLDRSCHVDSDCAVKNVGNCCGYFPACVNSGAQPDPDAVQAACADSGIAGVCGFREIQACSCVANTCEPSQSGVVAQ